MATKKADQSEKVINVQAPKKGHASIHAAFSAFQGELKPMAKNGKVQFETNSGKTVDFNYTPLGDIMEAIYPLLAKHGLAIRHEISKEGVEAILTHETYKVIDRKKSEVEKVEETSKNSSLNLAHVADVQGPSNFRQESHEYIYDIRVEGELRSGVIEIGKGKSDMKDTGAAITYARRYSIGLVLGLSSEEDKDAELLEQSAKNAIQTVYDRFKAGVEKAKTTEEVEKSLRVLEKDLKTIEAGKAPALGLSKEQYEELIKIGKARIDVLEGNVKSDE